MKKSTFCTLSIGSLLTLVFLCAGLFSVSAQVKTVKKVSDDLLPPAPSVARKAVPSPFQKIDMTLQGASKNMTLIEALSNGNTNQLLADLKALGLKDAAVFGKKINGYLPVSAIKNLPQVKNLVYAAPVYKPLLSSGPAYTNGDKALKSDATRLSRVLDGRGIKVGVLSDSYNGLRGAADGVFKGELPGESNPNGYTTEVQVLEDDTTGSDEGRAMIEIIHDIAPAAKIAFHTAYKGEADFAQGIIDLANAGCDIITDDVSYLTEPFFQDGIITQAIDKVVKEKGVSYYSSAGNYDRNSYTSNFRNGGTHTLVNFLDQSEIGRYVMHDFDPGPGVDIFQEIIFVPGDNLRCAFQWDDPFASACNTCQGAKSDLDFFFALSPDTTAIFLSSLDYNIDGDPTEILGVNYSGSDTLKAYVAFGRWIGAPGPNPNPTTVKYVNFGSAIPGEYNTNSPTVRGHANSKYGVSVGASAWFNTPVYGDNPALINYFSSVGGVPILFDTNGKRLRSPEVRTNPLFTATDGGNTSFFGQMLNDGDAFPNFFGTSAAAPHTAAVVAQLRQMAAKRVTGKTIDKILTYTALDMDDPFTKAFDKGYDRKTGYGLIQADKAVAELLKKVGVSSLNVSPLCSVNPDSVRNWKISNPNPFGVKVVWELIGTTQRDTFMAMPGDNFLSTQTKNSHNLLSIQYRNHYDVPVCKMACSPR
ncbi:MAG TPA: S8 family serine peptidase, partial [Bacteroidales bacterium]|nr:S8 family serine peptidase [Bacteroidales bacterium]